MFNYQMPAITITVLVRKASSVPLSELFLKHYLRQKIHYNGHVECEEYRGGLQSVGLKILQLHTPFSYNLDQLCPTNEGETTPAFYFFSGPYFPQVLILVLQV